MLGLGSSLITSPAPSARTPFDETWTFTSAADVSAWGIVDSTRVSSISYQASVSLGGSAYTNTMKVTMIGNAPGGNGAIRLANALASLPDGTAVKVEVDYGLGKNNDVTLRVASLSLGGTFKTVQATNQAANATYSVAPVTTANMGTTNDDLLVYLPADTALTAGDVVFIQRIRVYEP